MMKEIEDIIETTEKGKRINMKNLKDRRNPILTGIDWLQYSFTDETVKKSENENFYIQFDENNKKNGYYVVKSKRYSRFFSNIFEVWKDGESRFLAEIESKPHENFLPVSYGLIKISNHILYRNDARKIVEEIFENLKLTFRRVNRLDLFIDSNQPDNKMSFQSVTKNILNRTFKERNPRKIQAISSKSNEQEIEYLSIGGNQRRNNVIIYNKSLEMRTKTFKPYIAEAQEEAGLDLLRDVWRVEFTLKRDQHQYLDPNTGEIADLTKDIFAPFDMFATILGGCLERFLNYKDTRTATEYKNMNKVLLFTGITGMFVFRERYTENNSTKTEKTIIKKLCAVAKSIGNSSKMQRKIMLKTVAILINFFGLSKWFNFVKINFLGDFYKEVFLS